MKLFVWDLHGTLEQGNDKAVIAISNQVLEQFGHKKRFSPRDAERLYGLKWYEYFEDLLPELTHDQHLALQIACFEASERSTDLIAKYMQPSPYALEVLQTIKSKHHQILISNTVPATIPRFVKALGMQDYFDHTNAFAANAHAKGAERTKLDILTEYLQNKAYDRVIVIGDSAGDVAFGRAAEGTMYLYTHQGWKPRATGGDYEINDLRLVLQEM